MQTIYIPLYLIMKEIALVDTYTGIIWLYAIKSRLVCKFLSYQ
ncbi:hypothetical protein [Candidatus Darwinibacter acetoxidans]